MIKQKKTIHWYQLTCKREGEKKKKEEEEAEEEGMRKEKEENLNYIMW